jgi:hypothetical protein
MNGEDVSRETSSLSRRNCIRNEVVTPDSPSKKPAGQTVEVLHPKAGGLDDSAMGARAAG